jgi:signal peptidase I
MKAAAGKTERELTGVRDTIESIWIAIVLAFVLRAFMFEAFVIPTGSMAPRLVGEHWDLECPSCGLEYAYGLHLRPGDQLPRRARQYLPAGAVCPQCGYPYPERGYVNGGDRVLVLKYIYHFMDPRPWDVVVFKNPQNNEENYIKRLIGLPGETIEIINGDIYYRTGKDFDGNGVIDKNDLADPRAADQCPWRIRRKERKDAQDSMWQIVFDNDYRPDMEMIRKYNFESGKAYEYQVHPSQWEPVGEGTKHWRLTDENGRRFVFDGNDQPSELLFKADRWVFEPRYGYNSSRPGGGDAGSDDVEVCSDLNLSVTFVPGDAGACVSLILTSLQHRFRAEVRADGMVSLFHAHPQVNGGKEEFWLGRSIGPLKAGRDYELALWHVDYRVTLWVDDRVALQTTDAQYHPEPARLRAHLQKLTDALHDVETPGGSLRDDSVEDARAGFDLRRQRVLERMLPAPKVRIVARGGPCELAHVRLMRDVYYTYLRLQDPNRGQRDILVKYAHKIGVSAGSPGYGVTGNPITLKKHSRDPDLDEFFVLGDNSPQSLDGRAWVAASPTLRLWDERGQAIYTLGSVPRYSLIGRALFVYWPSGYRVPYMEGRPIIPNVGRMRLIR